jgi:hypothetical protein
MTRPLLVLVALAAIAGAVALAGRPLAGQPATPQPVATLATRTPTSTPAPPRLDHATLDRQDRTNSQQRRREQRAFDDRPLLAQLPLTLGGVRIDLAGLAADHRDLIVRIDPGARSRAFSLAVYRRALHALGDTGRGYRVEWARR